MVKVFWNVVKLYMSINISRGTDWDTDFSFFIFNLLNWNSKADNGLLKLFSDNCRRQMVEILPQQAIWS